LRSPLVAVISTPWLNTLLYLHLEPINVVVCHEPPDAPHRNQKQNIKNKKIGLLAKGGLIYFWFFIFNF